MFEVKYLNCHNKNNTVLFLNADYFCDAYKAILSYLDHIGEDETKIKQIKKSTVEAVFPWEERGDEDDTRWFNVTLKNDQKHNVLIEAKSASHSLELANKLRERGYNMTPTSTKESDIVFVLNANEFIIISNQG